MYALFLELTDCDCLVVGGGRVSNRKIRSLLDAGANVTVVSPDVTEEVQAWADAGKIKLARRPYQEGEAGNYFLIIGATNREDVNRQVHADGMKQQRLVNIVDVPELCNFYVPAMVARGDLKLAISTGGASPGLAKRIRKQLEQDFPARYAVLVDRLRQFRGRLRDRETDIQKRKKTMDRVLDSKEVQCFLDGDDDALEELLK